MYAISLACIRSTANCCTFRIHLNHEEIPYEPSAVEKLAKAAQGSIRDALSLTDQAIAVSNADIRLTTVQQMLGLIDDNQPIELVTALAQADGEKTMAIVQAWLKKALIGNNCSMMWQKLCIILPFVNSLNRMKKIVR